VPRQALQAVAGGVGVDLHEKGEVVERGRDDGGDGDLGVADIEELGDDEGRGAHHRRGQNGAGRRAGLDRAGVGGREARAFHGGDGHRAGGQHIGDDAPRHHAEHAAGEDADLGRAAAKRAAQREGEIDEELAGPRHHQGRAEDQEADHRLGEGLDGYAEQALAGEHVVGGRLLHGGLAPPQGPEPARICKQRIDREGQDAQQQAPAAGAAQRLHQHDPHDEAGAHHRQGGAAELPAELGRLAHVEHQVEAARDRRQEQPRVVPGDPVEGCRRAAREDHEREGQHAYDQEIIVFGIELRNADEEAQRELLVDAQEDGRRRRHHQQPSPHVREFAHARDLAFDRRG
jgi:hypothetical protein